MPLFKMIFRMSLVASLVFTSHPVLAQGDVLKPAVQAMNAHRTFPTLQTKLNEFFNRPQDKRAIANKIRRYQKSRPKWRWSFAQKNKNLVVLINGKPQLTIKPVPGKPMQFMVKGQTYHLNAKDGFERNYLKMEKILRRSSAQLIDLFVPEAKAFGLILGLVALVAVGGLAWWGSRRSANAVQNNGGRRWGLFGGGGGSSKVIRCVQNRRMDRMQAVSQNALIARGTSVQCPGSMSHDVEGRVRTVAESYANKTYRNVHDCRQALMRACQSGGWNMSPRMADAHCALGKESADDCRKEIRSARLIGDGGEDRDRDRDDDDGDSDSFTGDVDQDYNGNAESQSVSGEVDTDDSDRGGGDVDGSVDPGDDNSNTNDDDGGLSSEPSTPETSGFRD